tara:strand:- start:279 stop:563 length:285 start_codon:yes stop_codon:yes gene_type:complete
MNKRDNNMTFEELVNLPRVNRNGGVSLLGLWNDANESGDTEMVTLTMSAMAEQTRRSNFTPNNGRRSPQVTPSDINESGADRSRRLNMLRSWNE